MSLVKYESQGRMVLVTLNRPDKLNAINLAMLEEMAATWTRLDQDMEARVAVLTGAGRAFCVGLDMKEMVEGKIAPTTLQTMVPNRFSPRAQSKPVVAAINGPAVGAGLDFVAMDCDILVAAESATFGMPEVIVGMASLGSPFAAANVPRAIAMEMFLTGDPITARRAYETGFVNRVVPDDQVLEAAMEIAGRIAQNAPNAVQQSRRNLLDACQASEASRISETFAAHRSDMRQSAARGVDAFSKKQRPSW
ncbi:MAG: enoyl-CoA hydratase/isomerase family protein [Dehalococcoidia bacterium]|nr:enoyl-CoA hydratase/isomerase family protein [Dehalococcoidia bacterium]